MKVTKLPANNRFQAAWRLDVSTSEFYRIVDKFTIIWPRVGSPGHNAGDLNEFMVELADWFYYTEDKIYKINKPVSFDYRNNHVIILKTEEQLTYFNLFWSQIAD